MKLQITLDTPTAVRLVRAAVEDRRPMHMQAEVEITRALADRAARHQEDQHGARQ